MTMHSSVEHLYLEKQGAVATIFFNRPEKRNAFTLDMWKKIPLLLEEAENDSRIKVLILRSVDDQAFAAGADITEFKTLRSNAEGARKYNAISLQAGKKLAMLSKPTISMIQGYCIGGGCELAIACDFRFADKTAKFAITPAKLGIIYNLDGSKHLVDLVGPARAKDILYSGRVVEAEEALQIGLIERMFSAEEVEEQTYKYAERLARNAQMSIRGSKKVIREISNGATEESHKIAELVLSSFESTDYQEGVQAFMEKRKPNFTFS